MPPYEHYESPAQHFGPPREVTPDIREQVLADTVVRSLLDGRDNLHIQRKDFDEQLHQKQKELEEMKQQRDQYSRWWSEVRTKWDQAKQYLSVLCDKHSGIAELGPMIESIQGSLGTELGMDA